MAVNLLDGWFCDRSPGARSPSRSGFGGFGGGIVGVGVSSLPPPDYLVTLPPPGDIIPVSGLSPAGFTRQQMFIVFEGATAFDGHSMLTGIPLGPDSLNWSCSVWLNFGVTSIVGFTPTLQGVVSNSIETSLAWNLGGNIGVGISILPPNDAGAGTNVNVSGKTDAPGSTLTNYPIDSTVNAGWVHLMASVQQDAVTLALTVQLYIDDTEVVNEVTNPPWNLANPFKFSTANFTDGDGLHLAAIGGCVMSSDGGSTSNSGQYDPTPNDGDGLYAAVAELWLANGQYVDWSVSANRAKFQVTDALKLNYAPCNIGRFGQTPTGTAPTVYLRGTPPSFVVNRTTGGTMTLVGDDLLFVNDPPT